MNLRWLQNALLMTFRIAAITLGGYGLTTALCALAGLVLFFFGIPLSEAMLTTVLLGYLFYIALVMWAFADRQSFFRPWLIVLLAAVTMSMTSWLAPVALPR